MEFVLVIIAGAILGFIIHRAADVIPAHYPILNISFPMRAWSVPIINALLFAVLWIQFGASLKFAMTAIYTLVFLAVLIIDFERRIIPNMIILPAILFAALASFLLPRWQLALLGGVTAFVIVLIIYISAIAFGRWRKLRIQGGVFGQGDVTLATFTGLVTGFPGAFNAIIYTIFLGGLGAILFLIYHYIKTRQLALTAAIPYGPFFCIAGWMIMVFQ
jgi:prepilin signal peptidase PulO-like enzyme (type II secretory pathway)